MHGPIDGHFPRASGDSSDSSLKHSRPRLPSEARDCPSATASSALFARIPPEIRRQILIAAFGGRVIHLIARPVSLGETKSSPHQYRPGTSETTQGSAGIGYVCRRPASILYADTPPGLAPDASMPNSDRCVSDDMSPDEAWEAVHANAIGIVGWLLACQRAYIEGLDVLHTTNVFQIGGPELTMNLPSMISCRARARIQRVQLIWSHLYPWLHDEDDTDDGKEEETHFGSLHQWRVIQSTGMRNFVESINELPELLPSLRFLYLSLDGGLLPSEGLRNDETIFEAMEVLLGHVDRVVCKMQRYGHPLDCRIALPTICYGVLKKRATGKDVRWEPEKGRIAEPEAVWRTISPQNWCVSQGTGSLKIGSLSVGSGMPSGSVMGVERSGYWLVHGVKDVPGPAPPGYRLSRAPRLPFRRPV